MQEMKPSDMKSSDELHLTPVYTCPFCGIDLLICGLHANDKGKIKDIHFMHDTFYYNCSDIFHEQLQLMRAEFPEYTMELDEAVKYANDRLHDIIDIYGSDIKQELALRDF